MTKRREKEKAIAMRKQGKSYSEIKKVVGVSKGTLSLWLRDYPLSDKQIRELRDWNPRRIENYKKTCKKRREKVLQVAYDKAQKDIGKLSKRDLFIAGLFLYWGEGLKAMNASTSVANTDPATINAFIKWLELLGVNRQKIRIRLQLYSDMDINTEIKFWSEKLSLPKSQFARPYVKKTEYKKVSYRKGGFGHGTCDVMYGNRQMNDYVLMGIKYIQEMFE